MIPILAVVSLVREPANLWFVWPALGWGLGVASHGASVFNVLPFLNGTWEQRQVEKYLRSKL